MTGADFQLNETPPDELEETPTRQSSSHFFEINADTHARWGHCRKKIAVWRFGRFARSTKHLLLALEKFRSLGIQFTSYQENIDTSSPLGQALFTIVSAVAQLERDLIREQVSAGIGNARAKGQELDRLKSAVGRERILELKAQGHSLRQIAAKLGVGYGTVRARLQKG